MAEVNPPTAIVTGGAVRLGRALAWALGEQGARVVVHYNASAVAAQALVAQMAHAGFVASAVQADLQKPIEAAQTILAHAQEQFGGADILINSAAIFEPGDLATTTEDQWERHFAINLKAPFFLSQAFAAQRRRGHIINIADWRGARPGADHLAYTLTKAALLALTHSLAQLCAPDIQVNAIAPGAILPPPEQDPAYLERLGQRLPLQRAGSPEEIVKAMRYLLASDFVTGETIFVTGGQHL